MTPTSVERPIFRGEQVWLRAFEREDLPAYKAAANNPDVVAWTGYFKPQSDEEVERFYQQVVRAADIHCFAISPLGSRDFLGAVWLRGFGGPMGGPELAIFLGTAVHWGRGLGSDAAGAILDLAFGSLGEHRVWLYTAAANLRAQRAFEKVGFVREGVLRQHSVSRGERVDMVLMAVLKPEWEALGRRRSWAY